MKIQKISPDHNRPLYQLIRQILESHQLNHHGTAYTDPELKNLSDYYHSRPDAGYFVLLDEKNEVIGGAGYAPFSQNTCELQKLYIHKNFRGRGLGKRLILEVMRHAAKQYDTIYLETHSKLIEAHNLYRSQGFQTLERPHPQSLHSAMDIWMQRRLTIEKIDQ